MKKRRLDRKFEELKQRGEKGFVAYLTCGDPSLEETVDIVLRLEAAGVDVIELGLPFSDPLADGRVNQEAAVRALAAGATFEGVMNCVEQIRARSQIPMIFYAYMNPLLARGFESSVQRAAEAGMDGFLLLDLPVEEGKAYRSQLKKHGLDNIMLVTPTTPEERIAALVKPASGFVYCVSREGVTGVRDDFSTAAPALTERIRKYTSLPVALGFGIGTPAQAAQAAQLADAVVVGSAIVNCFKESPRTPEGRAAAAGFVQTLVRAVKTGSAR